MLLGGCVFLLTILNTVIGLKENPIVKTNFGEIRGLIATDGEYFMYLGIPYARVNKTNPFGAAIPFPEFTNGLEATNQDICPQLSEISGTLIGSIECLNLNIYVPRSCQISGSNRFPVLAYIHGGNYVTGSTEVHILGPKFLVKQNVIVITISYRLGPFGFMCLDTPAVPGNQGLKDQVTALRWIRKYIHFFGGDANKTTLSGYGSGSENVNLHLLSPQELLFHQAILEGGNRFDRGMYKRSDKRVPLRLAANLGFETNVLNEALTFLANEDPHDVISASLYLDIQYGPCIEKHFSNVEIFVTSNSVSADVPKVRNVSVIIGHTDDEIAHIFNRRKAMTDDIYAEGLEQSFDFDENRMNEMEKIVRRFYIGDTDVSKDKKAEVRNFVSDINSNHANKRLIDRYLFNGANRIYYSIFEYNGERNRMKTVDTLYEGGAVHGDELAYLFDSNIYRNSSSRQDQRVIDRMTALWTNFVKFGDPTPEATDLLPVRWTPVDNETLRNMAIGSDMEMRHNPFDDRMQFWDLFYILNWEYQKGVHEEIYV